MNSFFIVLSFLLMQSCIHCHVIPSSTEDYETIALAKQQKAEANKAYWQNAKLMSPGLAAHKSWLKYLSEEFGQALNENAPESRMQRDVYQGEWRSAPYEEQMMDRTPEAYRETMTERDENQWGLEYANAKQAARMDMSKTKTNYPQYVNYISKQVDVRSPETFYVSFPAQAEIVDEFGRIVRPTAAYLQPTQQYMNEDNTAQQYNEYARQSELMDQQKREQEMYEAQEQNDNEQTETARKTKTKHDKKEKKDKKQSMTKHEQETKYKSSERTTSQEGKRPATKHEEIEDMIPSTYAQNQARYKTPLQYSQDMLLPRMNGPFAFGKAI